MSQPAPAAWPEAARPPSAARAALRRLPELAPSLLAVAGLLLVWEVGVNLTSTPAWLLPAPSGIMTATVGASDLLVRHTAITLLEALLGFAAALTLGLLLSTAIALSRPLERALYPLIVASQAINPLAVAPLLLIWLGYGLEPKIVIVVLICFFPIVINTVDGIRSTDPDLVRLLRGMGATRWQIVRLVRLPAALPYLLSGAKVAVAVSVIGAVIGEWVGASAGLGYFMIRSAAGLQTARVFAAVVITALLGLLLFGLGALIEWRLLPWRHVPEQR
jgi:ABC-type nitrate/sulfonate/bicarbonate transport system permease component